MRQRVNRTHVSSIAVRIVALCIMTVLIVLFFVIAKPGGRFADAQSTSVSTRQTPVGKNCQTGCHDHDSIIMAFDLDAHGKSAKFLTDSRGAKCEVCHRGNADQHAETRGKVKLDDPSKLTSAEANESCLQCHAMDRTHANWRGSKHDRSDMSCLSCHNVHHVKMLNRMLANLTDKSGSEAAEFISTRLPGKMLASSSIEETCFSCHIGNRKDFFQRSTHLFRSELRNMKVGCTSCHNPHGGEGDKLLVDFTVNNVCYTCHAEKRGPFLWEHPPVRENCMNCHSPHGSSNPKLLTARAHLLCQECHIHMLPRHETTAGQPLDIWSINRGCLNCHGQVHGSNHPGGRTFTR